MPHMDINEYSLKTWRKKTFMAYTQQQAKGQSKSKLWDSIYWKDFLRFLKLFY